MLSLLSLFSLPFLVVIRVEIDDGNVCYVFKICFRWYKIWLHCNWSSVAK